VLCLTSIIGRKLSIFQPEPAGWDERNQSRVFASVVRRAIANGDHQGNDRNIGLDPSRGDPSHTCKLIDFFLCQRKQPEYNIEGLGAIVSVIFFT
jgi:hypothetical protein